MHGRNAAIKARLILAPRDQVVGEAYSDLECDPRAAQLPRHTRVMMHGMGPITFTSPSSFVHAQSHYRCPV